MANHKSAKKRIKQDEKRTLRNKMRKSRISTFIKKLETSIASGKKEEAQANFKSAQSEIFKGVTKGVVKKNTASRKISRLAAKVKAMAS